MMRRVRILLLAFLALAAATVSAPAVREAQAQSACPSIAYGVVLTAAQWNDCFESKLDNLGYTPLNPANLAASEPITLTSNGGTLTLGFDYSHAGTFTAPQTLVQPLLTFGSGAAESIISNSTNTGYSNTFYVENQGTVSNGSTIAQLLVNLAAGSNADIVLSATGGSSPVASLTSGAGLTGGFTISAGAGALNITSPTISTPSFTFATGGASTINAISGNTGFVNALESTNTGTSSNSGTIGELVAQLGCASCYVQMYAQGGTNPVGILASGTGLTGGFNISAGAGTLNLTGPMTFVPSGAGAASKYVCVDSSNNVLTQSGAC
jgi:hypothetical protein